MHHIVDNQPQLPKRKRKSLTGSGCGYSNIPPIKDYPIVLWGRRPVDKTAVQFQNKTRVFGCLFFVSGSQCSWVIGVWVSVPRFSVLGPRGVLQVAGMPVCHWQPTVGDVCRQSTRQPVIHIHKHTSISTSTSTEPTDPPPTDPPQGEKARAKRKTLQL